MMQRRLVTGLIVFIGMLSLGVFLAFDTPTAEAQYDPTPAREWDGTTPYTVLILGMDRRPGARDNLNVRTDVVIVARIEPSTQRIGFLNLPRDLHIALTNGQLVQINTLLVEGEKLNTDYGPHLAIETLQYNLGMYIDAYIAFDFTAFQEVVDLVGGVQVDVPYSIADPEYPDMNYGYDPFYINAGLQYLNGYNALRYVRTRHADSSFERSQRQLQVIEGIRNQLRNPATLQNIITNAPNLLTNLRGHVYTNIAPEQLLFMGLSVMEYDDSNFYFDTLNTDYSFRYTHNSQRVWMPDRNLLPDLLTSVFGTDYWR